ncbi:MAG: hypothetical protein Q8K70_08025 [Bacteroidota bacterium]|nr:hypothetical protein [Bacteroidota bacterium]
MNFKLLSLMFFFPLLGFSQWNENKKVYGEIIEQNLNPNFISLSLPFIEIEAITSNSNLFADAGLDCKLGKIFLGAKFRFNYADDISGNQFRHTSVYKEENSRSLNLGLGLIINTKTVEKSTSFGLKTVGNTEYYAVAVVPKTKFTSLHLGHQSGFTLYTGVGRNFIYKNLDGSNFNSFFPDGSNKTTTYMTYSTLSFGFRSGHYGYWKAKIENYGYRESQQMTFYYANLLVLYRAELDDVALSQLTNNSYNFQRVSLKDTKFSRFGVCMGFQSQDINKTGFGGKVEVGYYPGVNGNPFTNFGLTIASNFQISKLFK